MLLVMQHAISIVSWLKYASFFFFNFFYLRFFFPFFVLTIVLALSAHLKPQVLCRHLMGLQHIHRHWRNSQGRCRLAVLPNALYHGRTSQTIKRIWT